MVDKVFTTYQVAGFCKVHHTTVINWVNEGVLKAYTTPGGHRRIKGEDIIEFMKKYRMPLPEKKGRKAKRILIVDDDIEFLEELREALEGGGYELDCALNGFEAGRKIYTKKPDLILLDFKIPGLDGFQVCEVMHKDVDTAHIPVIAITSLKSEEDVARIKKCGVKKYLQKPLDIDQLKKSITKILKESEEFSHAGEKE
jgi:excisionase family DNA binding protein